MIPAELKPKSTAAIILHATPSLGWFKTAAGEHILTNKLLLPKQHNFLLLTNFLFCIFYLYIYSVCFCINHQGSWLVSDQKWEHGSYCDTAILNSWLRFEPHSLCHTGPLFGGKDIDMSTVLSRRTPKTPAPLSFVHMHHLR